MRNPKFLELKEVMEAEGRYGIEHWKNIEKYRQKWVETAKDTDITIEDVRHSNIFAAKIWKGYYVVMVSFTGNRIDEDGMYPDGTRTMFIDRKTGKVTISMSTIEDFMDDAHQMPSETALKEIPFNNLELE